MSETGERDLEQSSDPRGGRGGMPGRRALALLITGIAGFIVAILVLTRPPAALDAEVHLLGSYMVLSGALRIGRAQVGDGLAMGRRVILGVLGALLLVAGVAAVVHPAGQLGGWVVLMAVAWVLEAAVVLAGSVFSVARPLTLIAAVLCLCIALALLLHPVIGLRAVTASSAVFLVLFSAAQLFEGVLAWLPPRYETVVVTAQRRRP